MKRMFINLLVIIVGNSITYSMEPDIPINEIDEAIRSKNIISVNEFIPNIDLNIEKISDNAIFDVLGEHPENEELIKIAFRVAFRSVQREHNMQMQMAGIQVQNIFDKLIREHENEINTLNSCHNALKKQNALRGLLLRINVTDKTLIQYRATDIEQMNIFERHKVANEIYERGLPFAELFGRDDLDVVATRNDFSKLEEYLNRTTIEAEPTKPRSKPVCHNHGYCGCRGGEIEWNYSGWAWINSSIQPWLREMGVNDFAADGWDNRAGGNSWGTQAYINNWHPRAMAEYNRRLKEYNDKTSERAQQIERATAEPFPAEAFNRLIDQVNKFFIEGL